MTTNLALIRNDEVLLLKVNYEIATIAKSVDELKISMTVVQTLSRNREQICIKNPDDLRCNLFPNL